MITHKALGDTAFQRSKNLWIEIQKANISLSGNKKLKIYGKLDCRAGKKMKTDNRVFFKNSTEAISLGYRPCAVCLRKEYLDWKVSPDKK